MLRADPRLFVMPDDPALGEFRAEFAGMLAILDEPPDEAEEDQPGFAESRKIVGTPRLFDRLEGSPKHRVDARDFLAARLMDLYLGDRDRHADQWWWARFPDGDDAFTWRPIPRDRDQAFFAVGGFVAWFVPLLDSAVRSLRCGLPAPSSSDLERTGAPSMREKNNATETFTVRVAMKRLLAALAAMCSYAVPLTAQSELTVEAIFGSHEFDGDLVSVEWMSDRRHYTILESGRGGGNDLYRVEARSGEREMLVRGIDLVPPASTQPIRIEGYRFSPDGTRLLIFANSVRVWRQNTKGEYYLWDFRAKSLVPLSSAPGLQQFAKFSPDGRYVGFVRDHNIFVRELRTGREIQLTHDGDENVINGTSDWVYEEELDLQDAFRFSPDGARIAFWRFDQSPIRPFYLLDETTLYPTLTTVRYPKAGSANSTVGVGIVEIETGETSWVDLGPERDIYVAEMGFAGSSNEIWFTRLNRHQNQLDLVLADAGSGRSRVIMTDRDSAWVDANVPIWMTDGERFLFLSEREGFQQLYLFDRSGKLLRKVTPQPWDVTDVYGVDGARGLVYFQGAGQGPLYRSIYRVGLNGRNLERISDDRGWHSAAFDPTFTMYIDAASTAATPPTQTLHQADGRPIRVIADNTDLVAKLERLDLDPPEFTQVSGEGGILLNAYLIKPRDFDPVAKHPLLMFVYGGPGSQTVTDRWGGSRYLWHQMLANDGYLVASVDNRGTGARGRDFKKLTYLKLGQLESRDQIAAARTLASRPYVDADRIGIWGWSYGGYMSLLSMFLGAETFRAAISVAPVTDWQLYDTIYTERFMRTPRENPDGYRLGAPLNFVDHLNGKLLVVHGTGDDNVHSQNTTLLVKRLEDAGKQFDMRIYPNKTHAIAGSTTRVNLYRLFTEWLHANLRGEPATVTLQP